MDSNPYRSGSAMREELAFRHDLSGSIAVFVSRPNSQKATKEYFEFLVEATERLPEEIPTAPTLDRPVPVHAYEIPPAAGTWSEFAVLLWENGRPILENLSMLAGAAQSIRWVINGARSWTTDRQERANEQLQGMGAPIAPSHEAQGYFLSQAAITVLVVADLVNRFGYQSDLSIATHPRGFAGYNDPDHPNGSITYLIECRFAGKLLVYVVDSKACVVEHFEVNESKLIPLSVPDLVNNDDFLSGHKTGANGLLVRVKQPSDKVNE